MSTEPEPTEETEPESPDTVEETVAGADDTGAGKDEPRGGPSEGDSGQSEVAGEMPDTDTDDGESGTGDGAAGHPGLESDGAAEPGAAAGDGADRADRADRADSTTEARTAAADKADGAAEAPAAAGDEADSTAEAPAAEEDEADGTAQSESAGGDGAAAAQLTEAQAELAAQKLERERIERRRAEKQGPVAAGAKLSGKAADLLAAVRAVESGAKPVAAVFAEPEAPRRSAPEPERRPQPVVASPDVPVAPAAETVESVRRVLAEGGAPESFGPQVAAALGESAAGQLRDDPWQLLRVAGVRPEQADGFARALLGAECGPDDERRGRAMTVWLLEQAAVAGHTALELPTLTAALAKQGVPDADTAVQNTLAEAEALVFQDALDPRAPEPEEGEERPVRVLAGLERYALAEESLADGLARLINSVPKQDGSAADWERAASSAKGSAGELIRAVGDHGLVLHTGGEASLAEPAALLAAARELGLRAWAAAHGPLGRDRFRALTGGPGDAAAFEGSGAPDHPAPAATVTGLLSGAEGPGRDADGALDLDLLVVLDAPQLDVETAALLTESLPDGARLVLAGDPAVLWSAGPGRVFADLLAARVCPQVASRRPDPGPLGELVSGIGIGELNQVEAPGKEVVIVPVRDAGEAVHRTVQLVADSVPRALGVPADQTQVITPGHGGAAGTRALNAALKDRLNPGPGRFGGFDPGDRVAYSPTPGRTLPGRVVKADAEGLHLSCAGEDIVVPKERVEQSVRHGWALTAHQAAAGRWPAVVVVLPGDAARSLTRPWVYTAFSRAERHLSVVHGADQALPRAVAEIQAKPRTTRLPVLLATQVPAAG
ncbi:helix-hairpin-helix domain-containing protein [Streptomyces sp. S.PB5]|uniref:helix-hairpin-helix domain-containing protein n=1 Tax=Streptomyces sp. S.PB5 TaxID=3020844 RepID=UPI0025B03FFA|nr:helix-hairpin-helix domain-containing protein [Streptomyces sp. S.PB5]MDN3022156.1 helix-hairpin-helix domain-containing protein [Streptomyces sp. S.PB5]